MEAAEIESSVEESRGVSFLEWLARRQAITSVVAERVERVQAETSDRLDGILLKLGLLSESRLADELATYCRLPRLEAASLPTSPIPIPDLNEGFLRAHEIVPLRFTEEAVEMGRPR